MFAFLRHLFIPHKSNNHRAKILHHDSLLIIVGLLVVTSFFLGSIRRHFPGVLGISADISSDQLLLLTNEQRQHAGLSVLQLNSQLGAAASLKEQDMFAKDYWAHFAPDGTSPWDFIHAAGYTYVYAGENLARGFATAPDVINAWMASPEHRANMLSPNYQDVGFAVGVGRLPGDDQTVLVVEEFGGKVLGGTQQVQPSPTSIQAQPTSVPVPVVQKITPALSPVLAKNIPNFGTLQQKPLIDSASLSRGISILLLSLFLLVFGIDIIITEQRNTVRLAGHSFDHLLFLGGIVFVVIIVTSGVVV